MVKSAVNYYTEKSAVCYEMVKSAVCSEIADYCEMVKSAVMK